MLFALGQVFLVIGQVFFMERTSVYRKGQVFLVVVSKDAKIRNRYNQVPHLTLTQFFLV